nr:oligosaccharide flippase family protein [Candidatus Gracilibacteria bacterium]
MIEQHGSLSEKFIKKGFWLYVFSFITAPLGYIVKIIISGNLTVSEVGTLYGIISLIMLVSAYHDFGISESIYYFVPKFTAESRYDKVKLIIFYGFLAQVVTGLILFSCFFFGSNYLAEHYFKSIEAMNVLKIFAFYFLCINFYQIIGNFLMAVQNTFYNKLIELLRMGFVLFSTIGLFVFNYGTLLTFSYAWLFGLIVGMLFSIFIFYTKYYKVYLVNEKLFFDKELLKTIIKYSLLVFLSAQAATILGQIDMLIVIYMLGTEAAGYYTNYLSIISIPFMIIGPVFGFLFPVISELYGKNELDKIRLIKSIFTKNFLSIGMFVNILFFVFAETIAFILFGEKFIMSGIILKYSVLFLIFNYLLQINFQIMSGIGKVKYKFDIMVIAIIVNIITNIFFIKWIGVAGASLATGIGWIIIWWLSEYRLGNEFKVKYDFKNFFKNLLVFSLLGIFSYYFIVPYINSLPRLLALLFMILITILFIGFFILTNNKEIKLFINEIKSVRKVKNLNR